MEKIYIDYLSIFTGVCVFLLIAFFWFSKMLFGQKQKYGKKHIISMIIVAFIFSYFLSVLEGLLGIASILEGIYLGFSLWLGVVFPLYIFQCGVLDKSLKGVFVHVLFFLFTLPVLGGILAA